jgi:hypothetical protein
MYVGAVSGSFGSMRIRYIKDLGCLYTNSFKILVITPRSHPNISVNLPGGDCGGFLGRLQKGGGMRAIRAIVLSTWLYSLLLWLYVVVRITVNRVYMYNRFISSVPFFTFFSVGIISFALSFICLVVYLTMWGFRMGGEQDARNAQSSLLSIT